MSIARWESTIDSLKPISYQFVVIYDAFMEIFDDPRLNNLYVNTCQTDKKTIKQVVNSGL